MDNWTLYALYHGMKGGRKVYPKSWADIQSYIRSGKHRSVFAVGDQLVCGRNGTDIIWDIVDIDHAVATDSRFHNSLTLQTHDCIESLQFDATEALYSQSEILLAGTYHFTVISQTWYAADVGKSFQFTIENDIPANGQIVLSATYNATLEGKTIRIYSSGLSSTPIETAVLSEGNAGLSLGDAGNAVNGNFNSLHRVFFGSNNYKDSAIRQWLKSDKTAGQVWTPQTKWDRAPSWAASTAGFINGLDSDFLSVVGATHITTARTVNFEGGANADVVDDVFFLPSRSEVYGGNEVATVAEGTPFLYFSEYSNLQAPGTGTDGNRIKCRNGSAQWWWIRTPTSGNGRDVRRVDASGSLNYTYAYNNGGVSVVCNIF